jgi:hypothetical protein
VRDNTIAFIVDHFQNNELRRTTTRWQSKATQDAQKGQTSHPPNPGDYFTLPP